MSVCGALRAVLLDAFGTLLTLEPPAPALRKLLRASLGVEVTEAQASVALAAEISYYRAHMAQGSDMRRVAELQLRCAAVLRDALPDAVALERADAQTLVELLNGSLRFRAYPEVPGTLARLRAAGLTLVVVSNWDATLEQVLDRVGLRDAVDGVVASAVAGAAKPDPLPLRLGLELAGVPAAEAIHVGDGLVEDVGGALAAGVQPVWLCRDAAGEPPTAARPAGEAETTVARIAALDELPALCSGADRPVQADG